MCYIWRFMPFWYLYILFKPIRLRKFGYLVSMEVEMLKHVRGTMRRRTIVLILQLISSSPPYIYLTMHDETLQLIIISCTYILAFRLMHWSTFPVLYLYQSSCVFGQQVLVTVVFSFFPFFLSTDSRLGYMNRTETVVVTETSKKYNIVVGGKKLPLLITGDTLFLRGPGSVSYTYVEGNETKLQELDTVRAKKWKMIICTLLI